jgi:uncharacterized membrane protein
MSAHAPRSIDEYLKQLRAALEDQDPALTQDALYDAEEYLRAEVAAHPGKSEADVLELIASTYGAPEEVAAAYRDTEAKVRAALKTPLPAAAGARGWKRFFGVYLDPRAYTSLFYMLLSLATGILYFTIVVTGLSLSFGFAILIIGIPFFLAFIGITRVIALGEGRLLEAVTGERMPRRPMHPGPPAGWWKRIGGMLADVRTWTTLLYMLLMMPLGIVYFTVTVTGLAVGLAFTAMPFLSVARWLGWGADATLFSDDAHIGGFVLSDHSMIASLILGLLGVLIVTLLMHAARGIGRGHAHLAKALLVESGA